MIAGMATSRTACTLTVVGDGPARAGLERLAGELGLSGQVHFTGVVAPEAVPEAVSAFDIALQPKATSYASPLKIFDYMAAGVCDRGAGSGEYPRGAAQWGNGGAVRLRSAGRHVARG